MIELLINKRTHLPVVAKPPFSPWTARELDGPNLCVVALEDPPAELAASLDRHRVAANPFAECAEDPITKRPVMVRQSTIKLRWVDVRRDARVRMADVETVAERRE